MTLSRIINAASGVLAGMSNTAAAPVNAGSSLVGDGGGAAAAASSPADEVDRFFHGYMGGQQHHPVVHHYPQNPYTSGDYYGGVGDAGGVYYPSQFG